MYRSTQAPFDAHCRHHDVATALTRGIWIDKRPGESQMALDGKKNCILYGTVLHRPPTACKGTAGVHGGCLLPKSKLCGACNPIVISPSLVIFYFVQQVVTGVLFRKVRFGFEDSFD